MTLTAKQEAFAQAIANGLNQSDAYRSAYSAGKMKDTSINVNASKVAADAKVALRVTFLREELANKSLWTREQSVAVLKEVVEAGDAKANDKISAVKVLNDMQGFNAPAKVELSGAVVTRIELVPMRGNTTN